MQVRNMSVKKIRAMLLAHFVCWACACDTMTGLARVDSFVCLQHMVLRQQ